MKRERKRIKKKSAAVLASVCMVSLILGTVFSCLYVFGYVSPENSIHVTEKNTVNYRLHYTDSEHFDLSGYFGPSDERSHFLLGYTDYIEILNSYTADFDKKMSVSYDYKAVKTLVIRYMKANGNAENPVVMTKEYPLDASSGQDMTDQLSFTNNLYRVDLRPFQETYLGFVMEESERISVGIQPEQKLLFSAELQIDFIYTLKNSAYKMDETITRGLIIPISDEVYSISFTGTQAVAYDVPERSINMPALPTALSLSAGFILMGVGLAYGLHALFGSDGSFRAEVNKIIRRYNDDVVLTSSSANLDQCERIAVVKFKELLKISINLSKPITCYQDMQTEEALFFILCDGYVYEYKVTRLDR